MSCDNMQGNGHVAQHAFTSFARLKDAELGDWVAQHVAFPNSMVDRITPVTTEQTKQRDLPPTTASRTAGRCWPRRFTQWVLEDHFTLGRPPLERWACRWSVTWNPTS